MQQGGRRWLRVLGSELAYDLGIESTRERTII